MMRNVFFLLLAVSNVGAFQLPSKFKIKTPVNVESEKLIKERFGDKKLVVVTGTSSGLGRKTAQALLRTGDYHVVGAVRDINKMEAVAEIDEFNMNDFTPMHCELNSFQSVREFCDNLMEFKLGKPIDRLVCNAGVYQPSLDYAKWSADGHEQTMQINFLSHYLMISKLVEDMSKAPDPRVVLVGSVTGNDNTVGGGGVYPIADLKDLDGFKAGFNNPIAMADGYGFDGAKSYKDSKLCLMMLSNTLHTKFNKISGVSFSSIYPGCIAESPLFREKRKSFRKYFPVFMKYITGGFVSEVEAGQRLFQVVDDPRCSKSGVYWSWNGGPREDRGLQALEKGGQISGGGGAGGGWDSIYENDQSSKVNNMELGIDLFRSANKITGAEWPFGKQVIPTLDYFGSISKNMCAREELKRMAARPGFDEQGVPLKIYKRQKVQLVADKVASKVLRNTIGRVGRMASKYVLGRVPDAALNGSYQEALPLEEESFAPVDVLQGESLQQTADSSIPQVGPGATESDINILQDEISQSIFAEDTSTGDRVEKLKEEDNSMEIIS